MSSARHLALVAAIFVCLGGVALAHAQEGATPQPEAVASQQDAPQQPAADSAQPEAPAEWTGLPFTSLADYERLIPIGMRRRDLVRALGRPEAIMPGMGSDDAYHYVYALTDGSQLRAVIIVRDGAVLIRRLYISTPSGATARVN
jgi:hypothetical protein